MDVKILGTGCAKCQRLEAVTRTAVEQLGIDAHVDHVTDPADIASWGVMATPALVVDDEVVLVGKVPTLAEVATLLADR